MDEGEKLAAAKAEVRADIDDCTTFFSGEPIHCWLRTVVQCWLASINSKTTARILSSSTSV